MNAADAHSICIFYRRALIERRNFALFALAFIHCEQKNAMKKTNCFYINRWAILIIPDLDRTIGAHIHRVHFFQHLYKLWNNYDEAAATCAVVTASDNENMRKAHTWDGIDEIAKYFKVKCNIHMQNMCAHSILLLVMIMMQQIHVNRNIGFGNCQPRLRSFVSVSRKKEVKRAPLPIDPKKGNTIHAPHDFFIDGTFYSITFELSGIFRCFFNPKRAIKWKIFYKQNIWGRATYSKSDECE